MANESYDYVDTHGWDTVFAIDIAEVNLALAKLPESPTYAPPPVPVTGGTASLTWSFRNWRITDTPGGNVLQVTLDFAPGSEIDITPIGKTAFDGWTCNIVFQAHFDSVDPVTQHLKAHTGSGADWASVTVVPPPVPDPDGKFFTAKTLAETILTEWFATTPEAVELFEQEFAIVNIGADLATDEQLYYLQPVMLGFAGAVNGAIKALGILAMTKEKPLPKPAGKEPTAAEIEERKKAEDEERGKAEEKVQAATLELSPYAIMPGATAGYIVSARVFLTHMLMPACASAYNADEESFEIYGEGTPRLRNRKPLSFQEKLGDADQPAKIGAEKLDFAFEGAKLRHTIAAMNVRAAWNASMDVTLRESYALQLAPKKGTADEKIFLLTNIDVIEPEIEVIVDIGYVLGVEIIGGILSVASMAFGVMTFRGPLAESQIMSERAAKYVARLIAAVIGTGGVILALTPLMITSDLEGRTNIIPDFSKALNAGLDRIRWPGAEKTKFLPIEGHFANSMVVTIEPHLAAAK